METKMKEKLPIEVAREMLRWRQSELHIARYLSRSIKLKNEPSCDYRQLQVHLAEERVKHALDDLWDAMQ